MMDYHSTHSLKDLNESLKNFIFFYFLNYLTHIK